MNVSANPLELMGRVKRNMETAVVGKGDTADMLIICLAAGGHALIEDVPGTGKTSLVAALAGSVDCVFRRIQFTPDVTPSDVTGFTMFHPVTGEERFCGGAVDCNILLADELNRTGPKTQSALLQAMQEGSVTVDNVTRPLPRPFMVCATQNPVEHAGTYPLPEAQLDRFLMRVKMGYPSAAEELEILERNRRGGRAAEVAPVAAVGDVPALQAALDEVKCAPAVAGYIVEIAKRTREHKDIELGLSPRGAIALMRASMGRAMLEGRGFVTPDDVQFMAQRVCAHRITLKNRAQARAAGAAEILDAIVKAAPVPSVGGL